MSTNIEWTPDKEEARRVRTLKDRTHALCQAAHMQYRVTGPSIPDGMDIEVCGEKGLKELRGKASKFAWRLEARGLWGSRKRPAGKQGELAIGEAQDA